MLTLETLADSIHALRAANGNCLLFVGGRCVAARLNWGESLILSGLTSEIRRFAERWCAGYDASLVSDPAAFSAVPL